MTNLDSILKSRDIILPTKFHLVKATVFPVVMYGCECWTVKKAECQRIDAFELWCWRRLESPLNCKEIQPVYPKGEWSWMFIGRNDAEAETPILWPPHAKSWLTGKDPDAGKDWGQEEKGTTEDEMAGWHHRLDGHELEWTPGVGNGQGGLVCCDSWGRKELDTTEWLNWTELKLCKRGFSGKECSCQFERHGFDPWVGKIPQEKEMVTHSSILAWETPWTEEPGRLKSMGFQKSWTQLSY